MKKYILPLILALGIICLTGCSIDTQNIEREEKIRRGVSITEGDKRVIFDLRVLPYDMEYKEYVLPFSSCELYQEKSDTSQTYTPYIIAKVKTDGMDDQALDRFDEDLYVYSKISNENNQLASKELSKICEVDYDGYRYYVFSQSLIFTADYSYDFTESNFIVSFLILQGNDYRALQFNYNGHSSSDVKDLKEIGEEVWYRIKQKQLESAKSPS